MADYAPTTDSFYKIFIGFWPWSMIRKSGYRFSEKIMLKQKDRRDDDSKKSHPALAGALRVRGRLSLENGLVHLATAGSG
jgi:hypothetical protein